MPSLVYRGAANCDHRQSSGERRALEVKPRDHTGGHRLARLALRALALAFASATNADDETNGRAS